MQAEMTAVSGSLRWHWAGRVLSALAILFMLVDGVMKLFTPAPVVDSFIELGYPERFAVGIGTLEIACLAIYLYRRTTVLGAVLLTGFLGGAISTHVRAESDAFSIIFPVILGVLIWGGLYLRDTRLHGLLSTQD